MLEIVVACNTYTCDLRISWKVPYSNGEVLLSRGWARTDIGFRKINVNSRQGLAQKRVSRRIPISKTDEYDEYNKVFW